MERDRGGEKWTEEEKNRERKSRYGMESVWIGTSTAGPEEGIGVCEMRLSAHCSLRVGLGGQQRSGIRHAAVVLITDPLQTYYTMQ